MTQPNTPSFLLIDQNGRLWLLKANLDALPIKGCHIQLTGGCWREGGNGRGFCTCAYRSAYRMSQESMRREKHS